MTKARKIAILLLFLSFNFIGFAAFAQAPKVGRKAASKYFQKDVEADREVAAVDVTDGGGSSGGNVLMLHVGGYTASDAYQWGCDCKTRNVAKVSYGVTYLFDTWSNVDVNLRFDFSEFKGNDKRPLKLSMMPLWTFPTAETRFPLYFGLGAGLGVFFQQIEDESNLSFDYQLVAGARFMDLYENFGAFVEFGLKNHLHLLSDGQLNGTALTAGAIFTF